MAGKQIWDLWYPNAAATGLSFARGRLDASDRLWVHAAPDVLDVDVRTDDGELIARGKGLTRIADRPMTLLYLRGGSIEREDRWPEERDPGFPVIFPGGEVAILKTWSHAADESEWRWTVELYNHR